MGSREVIQTNFEVGDRVFAKISGYRHWPAQVTEKRDDGEYCVVLYGTHEIAYVKPDMIHPYNDANVKKYASSPIKKQVSIRTVAAFNAGMEEIATGINFLPVYVDDEPNEIVDIENPENDKDVVVESTIASNNAVKVNCETSSDSQEENDELDNLSDDELKATLEKLTREDDRLELLLKLIDSASEKRYKCASSYDLLVTLGRPGYIDADFLKTHPETIEIVRKMVRFVGNPVGWRMTKILKEQLEEKTAKIRKAAEVAVENFKSLVKTNPKPLAVQLMDEMNRLNPES